MHKVTAKGREFAAAKRGHIVQRVLVDGWSTAQAAAATGLNERQIAGWVHDYRRRGMASLRDPAVAERPWRRVLHRVRGVLLRWCGGLRRDLEREEGAICVVLRRRDEGRSRR